MQLNNKSGPCYEPLIRQTRKNTSKIKEQEWYPSDVINMADKDTNKNMGNDT